jgi:pyruvate/2-oxoglutarate dehydrogenase complex dihydrolipoamide dehydrogenase (E3) component
VDERLLAVAAGRSINTEGLGLEEAAVELDNRGRIKVDSDYKTTADGIYAAGDVVGPTLASVAMEQGRIAACRIFGIELKGFVDSMHPSAVYSMPEVAGVGLTEEQCRSQGLDYEVGRSAQLTRSHSWTRRNIEVDFQQERSPTVRGPLFRRHIFRAGRHRTDGHTFQRID